MASRNDDELFNFEDFDLDDELHALNIIAAEEDLRRANEIADQLRRGGLFSVVINSSARVAAHLYLLSEAGIRFGPIMARLTLAASANEVIFPVYLTRFVPLRNLAQPALGYVLRARHYFDLSNVTRTSYEALSDEILKAISDTAFSFAQINPFTELTAESDTVHGAIAFACNQNGLRPDDLNIEIVQDARRGVIGIGGAKAKIRATIRVSGEEAKPTTAPVKPTPAGGQPLGPLPGPTTPTTSRTRKQAPQPTPRIFILHSRQDSDFGGEIAQALKTAQPTLSVWKDQALGTDQRATIIPDTSKPSWMLSQGSQRNQQILDQIGICDLFVLVLSDDALRSPNMDIEVEEALQLNKRILPIVARRVTLPPAQINRQLQRIQWLDMSGGLNGEVLTKTVLSLLETRPEREKAPVPPPPTPNTPPSSDLMVGQIFGDYQVIELIGKGGMGTVYRGRDRQLNRDVALKVVPFGLYGDTRVQLERVARITTQLSHPNIATLYQYGELDEKVYLAYRLLNGGSLADIIQRDGPLSPQGALRVLTPIAFALDYAHQQGVIHLNIKPSKILFDSQGTPSIADFELAKLIGEPESDQEEMVRGTPSYMPPEQWRGQSLNFQSDIYNFGVTVFETLTGNTPFEGDTPFAIMNGHVNMPIPRISEANPDLPFTLDAVFAKVLAKNPEDRYQTAGAFVEDLKIALVEGETQAARDAREKVAQIPAPDWVQQMQQQQMVPGIAPDLALYDELLQEAEALLQADQWQEALAKYREALPLVPESQTAQQAISRLERALEIERRLIGFEDAVLASEAARTIQALLADVEAVLPDWPNSARMQDIYTRTKQEAEAWLPVTFPQRGVISATSDTNIRNAPSQRGSIIAKLPPRAEVTVLGQSNDQLWYNVRLEGGQEGWVSRVLLTLQPDAPVVTEAAIPPAPAVVQPPPTRDMYIQFGLDQGLWRVGQPYRVGLRAADAEFRGADRLALPADTEQVTAVFRAQNANLGVPCTVNIPLNSEFRHVIPNCYPLAPGKTEVAVDIYAGDDLLTTLIAAKDVAIDPASIPDYPALPAPSESADQYAQRPDLTLRIYTFPLDGQHLRFYVVANSPHPDLGLEGERLSYRDVPYVVVDYVLRATRELTLHTADSIKAIAGLREVGRLIWHEILPDGMARLWRKIGREDAVRSVLLLTDSEPLLPYELAAPDGRALADRYDVTRWVEGLGQVRRPEFPLGKVHLTGDTDALPQMPLQWAENRYMIGPTDFESGLRATETDGLHVILSGGNKLMRADASEDWAAFVRAQGVRISIKAPLITLAKIGDATGGGFSGLDTALQFVRYGAPAVAGAWWAVPPALDRAFWWAFYRALHQGKALGESLTYGRRAVRAVSRNPLHWLAYYAIGDTMAVGYEPVESVGYFKVIRVYESV